MGKRYAWPGNKALSLGIEGNILANTDVNGEVAPLANVANNFDRLHYHYELKSYALMLKAGLEKTFKPKFKGYLSAGLGGALNHLSNYRETVPSGSTARPMSQPFGDKSKGDFAFSLGTGIRYQVNSWATWGIGYRYLDTGQGKLNSSPIQGTTRRFESKRLAHHLITFSLTA